MEDLMGFMRCARPDPFAERVRDVYKANVVSAPRTGLGPMTVVAQTNRQVQIRGILEPILIPTGEPLNLPEPQDQQVAELTGARSAEVNIDVGFKLLGGFLTALAGGLLPDVSLETSVWKHASKFTFETRAVTESSVDLNLLGSALLGRRVNRDHPSAAIFFDYSETQMRLISRALTTTQVAIRAQRENGQLIKVGTGGIADILGKATASIGWKVESDEVVVFTGQVPATFAIAHVPCQLAPDGSIRLGLDLGGGNYLDVPGQGGHELDVDHYPLVNEDGLLEFTDL